MEITSNDVSDGAADGPSTSPASTVSSTAAARLTPRDDDDAAYLDKLMSEKKAVESTAGLDCTLKLINAEIDRVVNGRDPASETRSSKRFCDVTKDKPIKVTVRTAVPTRDHPKFNFVGKLLGPKGNSLKRLQEETLTKMAILGRGSMRDKHKEEECRHSHEPRYRHLNDDLHVEITAYAAPAEAHARIALALTEIRRFLVPDYNDDIRQEQLREMQMMNSGGSSGASSTGSILPSGACGAGSNGEPGDLQSAAQQTSSHLAAVRSVAGLPSPASSVMTLANPIHQQLSAMTQSAGMASPLRAVAYPPVLPLMHPALRGLCKPSQGLAIGLTAAGATTPLLNRYRPNAGGLAQLAGTCGPNSMVNLAHPAHHGHRGRGALGMGRGLVKDDFADPAGSADLTAAAAAAATLELYHRYNMQPYGSEGSDGVASPDDRDETVESDLLASANGVVAGADYPLLDGSGAGGGLKLAPSGLDRSRYRHEPYARYSTKVVT